jgi:hypothetical protein
MRRRIGAWADSFGLTDQRPRAGQSKVDNEEVLGAEELYVMPGWAVVKMRDKDEGEKATSQPDAEHTSPGEQV